MTSSTSLMTYINNQLPMIIEKSHMFRQDSQHSISFQTLTMLNGQHPYRILRQITSEIAGKRTALLEAALNAEKLTKKIEKAVGVKKTVLEYQEVELKNAVQNSIKDIAVLCTRYTQVEEKNGIKNWTEEDFETAEASFHIRRGFELLYQNLIQMGRPEKSIIEYLQQYGVHPQIATAEVGGYIALVEEELKEGKTPGAAHLEDFLDCMMNKYKEYPKEVSKRVFGTDELVLKQAIVSTIESNKQLAKLTLGE